MLITDAATLHAKRTRPRASFMHRGPQKEQSAHYFSVYTKLNIKLSDSCLTASFFSQTPPTHLQTRQNPASNLPPPRHNLQAKEDCSIGPSSCSKTTPCPRTCQTNKLRVRMVQGNATPVFTRSRITPMDKTFHKQRSHVLKVTQSFTWSTRAPQLPHKYTTCHQKRTSSNIGYVTCADGTTAPLAQW